MATGEGGGGGAATGLHGRGGLSTVCRGRKVVGVRPRADDANSPWATAMLAAYCWINFGTWPMYCWVAALEDAAQIMFLLSFSLFILLSLHNNGACFCLL